MANFVVRNLDDGVHAALRLRASNKGVSMEEEVRQILTQAVNLPEKLGDEFLRYFGENNGVDLNIIRDKTPHMPMEADK